MRKLNARIAKECLFYFRKSSCCVVMEESVVLLCTTRMLPHGKKEDGGHGEDLSCAKCLCVRSLHHKQRILQSIALVPSRAHWIETKAALGNQGSCKLFLVPVSSIAPLSQHVCLSVCGNCFFILRAPVPSVLRKGLDAVVESLP